MKGTKTINTAVKSNEVIETSKLLNVKGGVRGTGAKCPTCTSTIRKNP